MSTESTSHDFKLKLTHIPRHYNAGTLRKELQEKFTDKLHMICKKGNHADQAYIGFKSLEDRQSAIDQLKDYELKKQRVGVEIVEKSDSEDELSVKKAKVEESTLPITEQVQDKVTPFWRQDYDRQIVTKSRKVRKILAKYQKQLLKEETVGFEEFIKMPIEARTGYRNKCEFAIGKDNCGESTVGFTMGTYKEGIITVASPESCLNVNDFMKLFVREFQQFIRENEFPVYDRLSQTGFWRLLTLRSFSNNQMMILLQVHKEYPITDEHLVTLKESLIQFCLRFPLDSQNNSQFKVCSLQWQRTDSKAFSIDPLVPYEILFGEADGIEKIGENKFRVSPHSFLQVNLQGTEILYDLIATMATKSISKNNLLVSEDACSEQNQPDTCSNTSVIEKHEGSKAILLDLCCGAGTIGISLHQYFKRVIGIESVPEAIQDALFNTKLNELSTEKFEWICDKLEDCLNRTVSNLDPNDDIVVILDPPRSGVHGDVIKCIRNVSRIKRLVFVSCHADQALLNFVDLSRPTSKRFLGNPFHIETVIGVDIFPHTEHYELLLLFNRE